MSSSEDLVVNAADADELIPVPADVGPVPILDGGGPVRVHEAVRPPSTFEVRSAYLDQSVLGYLMYSVGAVSAFLAVALSLSDAQAGLHSSAFAVGVVSAGLTGDRLDRLLGARMVHIGAYLLLVAAIVLLAWAPAFVATLAGAAAVGLGTGLILGHINETLTSGGGTLARVYLARSTLIAMVASLFVPLVIGVGVATGIGWQLAFAPAAVLIGPGIVAARRRADRARARATGGRRLPRRYWLAWLLVVLVVAVEFANLYWGSTLVERQVGISLGDATLVLTAFFAGMVAGRFGLSFRFVSRRDPVWLMRAGITLALLGALLSWASSGVEFAALGLFLSGLGVSIQYPLGVSISLASAPGKQGLASARLVLASGMAILLAPLALGVFADAAGVVTAWLLIPVVCLVALALTIPVARSRR